MDDFRIHRVLEMRSARPYPEDERWRIVEASLGLRLPRSYKNMVDAFGASGWCEFLHELSPFSDNPRLNLRIRGDIILDAGRTSRATFPAYSPFPFHPEAGGLLPWAVTDNGDTLYWITSAPPDEWPTLIKGPGAPGFEVSFGPPHMLVYHTAGGKYRSVILADPSSC